MPPSTTPHPLTYQKNLWKQIKIIFLGQDFPGAGSALLDFVVFYPLYILYSIEWNILDSCDIISIVFWGHM